MRTPVRHNWTGIHGKRATSPLSDVRSSHNVKAHWKNLNDFNIDGESQDDSNMNDSERSMDAQKSKSHHRINII